MTDAERMMVWETICEDRARDDDALAAATDSVKIRLLEACLVYERQIGDTLAAWLAEHERILWENGLLCRTSIWQRPPRH